MEIETTSNVPTVVGSSSFRFRLVSEGQLVAELPLLQELWLDRRSFILIPEKSGIDRDWLLNAVNSTPVEYKQDHFCLLSSGSTGRPKLVIGNKERSELLVKVLHELQESDDVVETVGILPLSYSYSFINQWLWSFIMKRKFRATSGFKNPQEVFDALLAADSSMVCMVYGQVTLFKRYFPDQTFPGVIRLHFAGGLFPQDQLPFIQKMFPNAQIFNNYGCVEAMPRLTIRKAEEDSRASHIGYPLPGVEIRIDAENRIEFRSPFRAVAFVDENGFRQVEDDEWIQSGDLGEPQTDGSWILLGRSNDVFKRHGEKVSIPMLMKTVTKSWDGQVSFYRETDSSGESACVLVISPHPTKQQVREILKGFRLNHTRAHWPIRLESVDRIPLLQNGKTDKMGLRNCESLELLWRQRI